MIDAELARDVIAVAYEEWEIEQGRTVGEHEVSVTNIGGALLITGVGGRKGFSRLIPIGVAISAVGNYPSLLEHFPGEYTRREAIEEFLQCEFFMQGEFL